MLQITHAATPEELDTVRTLVREYEGQVPGAAGCFTDLEAELATLPGTYAAPAGRLLIATDETGPVGCVALRPLAEMACELKRLYVRPAARGRGVARRLATTCVETARAIGYRQMLLETLPSMLEALALYRSLGFRPERRSATRVGWTPAQDISGPEHLRFWLDLSGPGIR
jgi:ribosomal protein S18 acetylase RimI-like enzyme